MRFGDERLKQLRGANGRPRSLASKNEAESIEQPDLKVDVLGRSGVDGIEKKNKHLHAR